MDSKRELEVLAVAYVIDKHGAARTFKQMAFELGLSQVQFGRLRKEALASGYLVDRPRMDANAIPEHRLAALDAEFASRSCLHDLDAHRGRFPGLQSIHVFHSGGSGTDNRELRQRLEYFSESAATLIFKLLSRSTVAGVSWGNTLAHLIAGIEHHTKEHGDRAPDCVIAPMAGEAFGAYPSEQSSSDLSRRLAQAVQARKKPLSLAGVGAIIPQQFNGAKLQTIRDFIEQADSFRSIFGSFRRPSQVPSKGKKSPRLVDSLDMFLTSCSVDGQPWRSSNDFLLHSTGIDRDLLTGVAYSDIGGVLIRRAQESRELDAKFRTLEALWTGIQRSDLERLVKKAESAQSKAPGVVLATIGANKARTVHRLLQEGLVSVLIIDQTLGNALLDEIKRTHKTSR
ncbi:MAG: hypothetical protein HYV27_17650 [Candidatus Hydrogenedentes bacterium]|nr:hypothetical protein [Candidatus Hydrogenedentota bacterium]